MIGTRKSTYPNFIKFKNRGQAPKIRSQSAASCEPTGFPAGSRGPMGVLWMRTRMWGKGNYKYCNCSFLYSDLWFCVP